MFLEEKRVLFPFILPGTFDLEGLGAGAGLLYTIETKHTQKIYTLNNRTKKDILENSICLFFVSF
jgi:hypothetical protein